MSCNSKYIWCISTSQVTNIYFKLISTCLLDPFQATGLFLCPLKTLKKSDLLILLWGKKKERPITFSRLRRTNGQVHNSSLHSQDHRTTCFTLIKLSHLMSFWLQKCKIIKQWRNIRLSMVQKIFKISQSSVNPCLSSII